MSRINISPSELEGTSREFTKVSQEVQTIINQLNSIVSKSQGQWEGNKQKEFLNYIDQSLKALNNYSQGLTEVSNKIKKTANLFREIDSSRS